MTFTLFELVLSMTGTAFITGSIAYGYGFAHCEKNCQALMLLRFKEGYLKGRQESANHYLQSLS